MKKKSHWGNKNMLLPIKFAYGGDPKSLVENQISQFVLRLPFGCCMEARIRANTGLTGKIADQAWRESNSTMGPMFRIKELALKRGRF